VVGEPAEAGPLVGRERELGVIGEEPVARARRHRFQAARGSASARTVASSGKISRFPSSSASSSVIATPTVIPEGYGETGPRCATLSADQDFAWNFAAGT
jgi:hypothetical protein